MESDAEFDDDPGQLQDDNSDTEAAATDNQDADEDKMGNYMEEA
jgi:hypothetical protein